MSRDPPEVQFARYYRVEDVTAGILCESLDAAQEWISRVPGVPHGSNVNDYEVFSSAPFCSMYRDSDCAAFQKACVACFGFVSLVSGCVCRGVSLSGFSDQIRSKLFDDWSNCSRCPELQDVLRAAFGLGSGDNELLDRYFTGKVLGFLADSVLVQGSLCECRVFQLILECVGQVFVFEALSRYPQRIQRLLDNERLGGDDEWKSCSDFQSFLRVVGCISGLRRSSDFADKFLEEGSDFLHSASEFVSTGLFCTYFRTLGALCRSKSLSESIMQRLDESISDMMNLRNCLLAVKGHADDFNSYEIDHGYLSRVDAEGLEAVLVLVSRMFFESEECRHTFADDQDLSLVNSVFQLIHSRVPASLKARCFDVLSSLTMDESRCHDLWQRLITSQILTDDIVERGEGGILNDVEKVESDERFYPLLRSFLRFLSFLLRHKPVPVDFRMYNQFLFEQCLLKASGRIYGHVHEKWALVSELCQCWTNLSLQSFEDSISFLRTALCDNRFVSDLTSLSCEEQAPQETLLCIYRLFLLVSQREEEFRQGMDVCDQSSFIPMTSRLSWCRHFLGKLIRCISSNDRDLQIICIDLAQFLGSRAGKITQIVFSEPQSKAISIFRKCILVDESEDDPEQNVRNKILSFLSSLGHSSYFVRCVCGFDMSDFPRSLQKSSLEKGIIATILGKLQSTEAAKNYPEFASRSFELLLNICDDTFTCSPALNFLRSSGHSFFNNQLRLLEDRHSLNRAIGCYLQLLAREATESEGNTNRSTTLETFKILFGTEGFREHRSRVVLILEFVDRIGNDSTGTDIALGVYESCVAYGSNSNIRTFLGDYEEWRSSLCQFIWSALGQSMNIFNKEASSYLTKACAYIGEILFVSRCAGPVSPHDFGRIFSQSLSALHRLFEMNYGDARFGIYSLISSMKGAGMEDIFRESERFFFSAATFDLDCATPIVRSSVFSAAQAIIGLADEDIFMKFVQSSVDSLASNWDLFDEDHHSGAFVLNSHFNFFSRLIVDKNGAFGRRLLELCVVDRLCHDGFWNTMNQCYITSVKHRLSENILETGRQGLRVICNLCCLFGEREDVHRQSSDFFLRYSSVFRSVCNSSDLFTLVALKFLDDLFSCYLVCTWLLEVEDLHLRDTFDFLRNHIHDDCWYEKLREKSGQIDILASSETLSEANEILAHFRSYLNCDK